MDYIVYIQPVCDCRRDLVPKEVAVVSLQTHSISHWIVTPPCSFTVLPRDMQKTNSYGTTRLHGLQWPEGDCTISKCESYLREISTSGAKIYVKRNIAGYVERVIGRSVYTLDDFRVPKFTTLEGRFKNTVVCNQHERRKTFFSHTEYCALHRASLLREWLWTLVPEEWSDRPTISSELFLSLLHKTLEPRVQFEEEDEVDSGDSESPPPAYSPSMRTEVSINYADEHFFARADTETTDDEEDESRPPVEPSSEEEYRV